MSGEKLCKDCVHYRYSFCDWLNTVTGNLGSFARCIREYTSKYRYEKSLVSGKVTKIVNFSTYCDDERERKNDSCGKNAKYFVSKKDCSIKE